MKRLNLLFCGELPPTSINGISLSSCRILHTLSERFNVLTVLEIRRLNCYGISAILFKIFRVFFESAQLIFKIILWRPKTFYITFPTSVFGGAKCLLFIQIFSLLGNGRILLHVHRGDLVSFYQRGRLSRFIVRACFDNSSTILSLSRRQSIAYKEITDTPIMVLPNAVNCPSTFWQPPELTRIVYLSNYLPDKGLETLIDAFKVLQKTERIELHCYGGGDSSYYSERIKKESIDNVIIHGVLGESEKNEVLKRFSLLAFPSYNEGLPLVVIEAMALGLPIVSSNVGLISEMLGEDYPYLIPPKNAESLAKAIQDCLYFSDLELLSMNLRERFERLYSPESQKLHIWEAFEPERNMNYEI